MKSARVEKFLANGWGRIRYDRKIRLHYLELFKKPSNKCGQLIRLGVDPGSCFDGFSVVSKYCHHDNFELVQRPKTGKNSVKFFKTRQSETRRTRRSRLWHRPCRNDNRTSSSLTPTIRANNEFRKWLVKKILKYYPIKEVELEDVRYDHFNKRGGDSFSHVEIGKTDMENFFEVVLGLRLVLTSGYETSNFRKQLNGGADQKVKDKGSKEFNAHCIDSYVLGCRKSRYLEINDDGEEVVTRVLSYLTKINTKVTYIEKIVKIRRRLTQTRKRYKDKSKYYNLEKGGVKVYCSRYSNRRNVIRVKPDGIKSNHLKQWTYIDLGFAERFKYFTTNHGGTRLHGKTFFQNNEWNNRKIEVRYK